MSEYKIGDICPDCGNDKLVYDAGEPMTRDHPGDPPGLCCYECGFIAKDNEVDWDQVNYVLNEK